MKVGTGNLKTRLPPLTHTQFVATFHSSLPHVYISFSCAIFHFVPSSTVKIFLQKKFTIQIFGGRFADFQTELRRLLMWHQQQQTANFLYFVWDFRIFPFARFICTRQQVVAVLQHFSFALVYPFSESWNKTKKVHLLFILLNFKHRTHLTLNAVHSSHNAAKWSGGEHLNGLNTFHIIFFFLCPLLHSWFLLKNWKCADCFDVSLFHGQLVMEFAEWRKRLSCQVYTALSAIME